MNNNIYQPQQPYGAVPSQQAGYIPTPQTYGQEPVYNSGYNYNNYNQQPIPQQNYPPQQAYPPQQQYDSYNKPYSQEGYQAPAPGFEDQKFGAADNYNFGEPLNFGPIDEGEKFPENNGWRDLWFFVLFLAHFALVGIIFGFGVITRVSGLGEDNDGKDKPLPEIKNSVLGTVLLIVAACAGVSLVLSYAWLIIIQKFAKHLIKVGMVFSVLMFFGMAALSFAVGSYITGIILAVFGGMMILFYFLWRKRIKFATKMLKLAGRLVEQFPATVRFAFLAMLVQFLWIAFWAASVTLAQQYSPVLANICAIYLVFSLYWTSQVIKNVVHVTTSGTMATWYFMSGTVGMPHNPTVKSFKRATTTSIGSICFGSLIIAILRTLRFLANSIRAQNQDNFVLMLIACLAACILGCIESLVEYFNQYAFAQVAIYGKSYIQAAKDTWALVKSHGMAAIINDNLIGNVMGMVCFVSAAASGTVGALMGWAFEVELGGDYWLPLFFAGAFVGFIIVMTVTEVVESAVTTIFVCFAEDPEALRNNDPKSYKALHKAHHHGSDII